MNEAEKNQLLSQILNLREDIIKKIQPALSGLTELAELNLIGKAKKTEQAEIPAHIHDWGDEVIAVVEIPGLQRREDLHLLVKSSGLELRGRRYKRLLEPKSLATVLPASTVEEFHQEVNFPCAVRPETATATYRHGLLEVRVKKLPCSINENVIIQFL
ncbi:MAG: Hsp20/alpha crystallin family protein [Desulfofundulus sp.]|uniref:Hsp20/alpha crystallin family protein n=1 Tax=Desulfofundulus sp. TaxID=2282750 RepID=UPI003C744EDA